MNDFVCITIAPSPASRNVFMHLAENQFSCIVVTISNKKIRLVKLYLVQERQGNILKSLEHIRNGLVKNSMEQTYMTPMLPQHKNNNQK